MLGCASALLSTLFGVGGAGCGEPSRAQIDSDAEAALVDGIRRSGKAAVPESAVEIVATEPSTPPLLAGARWSGIDSEAVVEISETANLELWVEESPAQLVVDLRIDADGSIFEESLGPVDISPGKNLVLSVNLAALGVVSDIPFAAMIEGKLRVIRDGHTRTWALEPVFSHPTEEGLLLYGEESHRSEYAAGDFRGLIPETLDDEGDPVAHVSVARVRVLPVGEDPVPE